ncbi:piggyBac transposable element-derived protein 3-like [Rhopalosiphum maidis]|uniref:piggyBac transposable element-derived protein 3-like n=1 Tax=Rhopalosiphum maidis TaxID=43146 RepID=UPI000F00623D|nr:piggyBac transposable element-derived protein 3-like [Rhopalosiphum maidis]
MAQYTNLYSEQKNLNNFNKTDSAEMKIMIAIHMLFGVLNYPRSRMYWENKYRINIIANNMSRNRFFQLRNCFHVIDNESVSNDNRDKFVKIRPLHNSFIKRCSELPKEKNLCIDEQLIPFKGNLSIKQYIKGKPTPWGIKNCLLCGQSGIVYNSLLYQGSNTNINDFMQKNYGLGGAVVLKLVENLKPNSHNLFFDNFFSSYNLFGCLLKYKIFAIGTIRCNRFCNPPFPKDKELAKMGHGTSFEVSSIHNITLVKWFDNKAVSIGSNFIASGIPIQVKRFDRKEKCSVIIECPEIINI